MSRASLNKLFIIVAVALWGHSSAWGAQCFALFQTSPSLSADDEVSTSERTENWSINGHPLTIGIEIEGHIPDDMAFREVARRMVEHNNVEFPDHRLEMEASWMDGHTTDPFYKEIFYDHVYVNWGGPFSNFPASGTNDFFIHDDSSIGQTDGKHSVEIGSPILTSAADLQMYLSSLNHLIETEVYSPHTTAGLHIHVGMPDAHPSEVTLLARLFTAVQNEAYRYFQVLENRARKSARPLPGRHWRQLQNRSEKSDNLYRLSQLFTLKSVGLNLNPLIDDRHTVEFRLFNSTDRIDDIYRAVAFSVVLVEQARTQGPLVQMLLNEPESENLRSRLFQKALRLAEDWLRETGWSPSNTPTSLPTQYPSSAQRVAPEMETPVSFRMG